VRRFLKISNHLLDALLIQLGEPQSASRMVITEDFGGTTPCS
jgi:hypothetical protein